jgi:hypothetical protein
MLSVVMGWLDLLGSLISQQQAITVQYAALLKTRAGYVHAARQTSSHHVMPCHAMLCRTMLATMLAWTAVHCLLSATNKPNCYAEKRCIGLCCLASWLAVTRTTHLLATLFRTLSIVICC